MASRTERLGFGVMCLGSAAFSTAYIWRSSFRIGDSRAFDLLDDAMISMRYGRNLAEGHGLVWNPGGDPVEGITNPLWTVWMALLHLLPVDTMHMPLLVMLSSAGLILGCLWVARRLAHELSPGDTVASLAAVALTATFFPLVYWSLGGMEVGLLAFLVGLMALCAVRLDRVTRVDWQSRAEPSDARTPEPLGRRSPAPGMGRPAQVPAAGRWALRMRGDEGALVPLAGRGVGDLGSDQRRLLVTLAWVSAATVLVRTDALLPVAVVCAYVVWRSAGIERGRLAVMVVGPPLAALALLTLWRLSYYGEWLPNTYYLKMTGTSLSERLDAGLGALVKALFAQIGLPLLAAAFAAFYGDVGRRVRRGAGLLAALVGGQIAYSVWVGGDAWEALLHANRYLTIAVVPLMVLAGRGLARLSREPRVRLRFCQLVAVVVVVRLLVLGRDPTAWFAGGIGETALATVLVGAGAVVLMAAIDRRLGRVAVGLAALLLTGLLATQMNLHGVVTWRESEGVVNQPLLARQGTAIRQATAPDTVMAVWMAGTEPYFADRPAVDLYGKSDHHIARLPAVSGRFWPGHMKSDLEWSLTHYRPDLVQMLAPFGPRDQGQVWILASHGYEDLGVGWLWVRSDSENVDVRELRAAVAELVLDAR